jgi:hypothetical protein
MIFTSRYLLNKFKSRITYPLRTWIHIPAWRFIMA